MKILYVHDLFEKANDVTSQALKEHFVNDQVNTISIPYDEPSKAINIIEEASKQSDLLVATGLGCYLSLGLKDVPKILINFLFPGDVKEQFADKKDAYVKLEENGLNRKPEYDYSQQIYNQENTFYLFGTEDEIANNIGEIDGEIQFEAAGYMFLDGASPFSGLGFRYYRDEDTAKKYYSYGNVYEVYSTKHIIDSSSINCLEAIDDCIRRVENRKESEDEII